MELVDQRSDAGWLRGHYAASERRVCGLMGRAVSSYRYESQRTDEPLRTKLVELARSKPLLERTAANQEWALDFVHDAVECGRTIRELVSEPVRCAGEDRGLAQGVQ